VVILATLDTKGEEAEYLRGQIESLGGQAQLIDMGVLGESSITSDVSREEVAAAGGVELSVLLEAPNRETAAPIMAAGATKILLDLVRDNQAHAVLGIGGTQGTSSCTQVMQSLPYGFPKLMVSTAASGDTSSFVGIKDISMMFSVSDLMGLNPFTERILSNAASAAYGMSLSAERVEIGSGDKPLIAMTNLGVLTEGATHAITYFREAGYDTVVFHAVGSGGQAMEQLMKDGVVGAVFDYALGEISDEIFDGLRAGGPERLTVAGSLGLPQVICPGGAEHVGLFVDPDVVPEKYRDHQYTFHSPVILSLRLKSKELIQVAEEICKRLENTKENAVFMLPLRSTGRYSIAGGPLHDPEGDEAFFDALRANLPHSVNLVEIDADAEDPMFVREAARRLIEMLEAASYSVGKD
tara:strand:- start:172 stop:1404 length:1233 start_codon:yes stop_codon:yes gene_type:complete